MFRKIAAFFGFVPASVISSAPAPAPAAREYSAEELKVKIRHALNDSRFAFRTVGALARIIGSTPNDAYQLASAMPDVRGSRDNHRRGTSAKLFTFAN